MGFGELRQLQTGPERDNSLSVCLFLVRCGIMRSLFFCAVALAAMPLVAAERAFEFSDYPLERTPPGFRSTVAGQGQPGDWKIILDDVAPALEPLTSKAPSISRRAVLAQVARNPADEHFPMLIFEGETYRDFTLATRFKIAGGAAAQMAGMVFRFQDEKNFYVLLASSLDNRFWFYKMVNGVRGPLIGPQASISKDQWHEMTLQCEGNHIQCSLDGKPLIPMMTDNSFTSGKIGFWAKSDSICYFADTKVTYREKETLAQKLVREAMAAYPRLVGLKIYAATSNGKGSAVVASKDPKEMGQTSGATEQDVISRGTRYFGKAKDSVLVTVPLRDRNGDPIAAVCVVMKSFPGQTEDNAAVRAQPVVQRIQAQVQSLEDLLQ